MNITYACSKCHGTNRTELEADTKHLDCNFCGQQISVAPGSIDGTSVKRCLVCPSTDLFMRKDFPQRLGVAIVAAGIISSSIAWGYGHIFWTYFFLFLTALIDVLLFAFVGDALMCYRCNAQYRGASDMTSHGQFDLEVHEKYRQIEAQLEQQKSAASTTSGG